MHKHREKATWGWIKKATYMQRKEALEIKPADTSISSFHPLKLWDNKCLLFKPNSLCYFFMATLVNE